MDEEIETSRKHPINMNSRGDKDFMKIGLKLSDSICPEIHMFFIIILQLNMTPSGLQSKTG